MLPLDKLGRILFRHLAAQPTAEVLFSHKVVSQGQDVNKAWVEAKISDGETKKFEADYIVGCDGANSQIRRSLFGDLAFPGRTWDEQLVATNVSINLHSYFTIANNGRQD